MEQDAVELKWWHNFCHFSNILEILFFKIKNVRLGGFQKFVALFPVARAQEDQAAIL